ncbi:MAG: DUF1345 domain-containing protein [Acetobacteraceae bacterium]|nr:DUF1345 domain-containing protein [Acetobacteraceae bacterium]
MALGERTLLGIPWRIVAGRPRLVIGLVCGLVSWPFLPPTLATATNTLLAWNTGVVVYLVLSAIHFVRQRPERMRIDAERQEEGEWTIFWITMAAVIFSFVAILGVFANTKDQHGSVRDLHVALVAVTLFLSWLMTHTSFAYRYAHEYYELKPGSTEVQGGLNFPGGEEPDYLDFAYFALVIGMTFQVSDVQITSRKFRRLAALQGLMGFLFNTIILALTVNIAAGLL